ncbi:hypothetical protein ACTX0Y_08885 [Pseudomonas aeruginosa]|uniref:hypothetical protein n=1 Tax=Pseudomonas aeruginosa TaxID=287 RepID=UPI003FD23790|nr:hypothetical protein [Pseudomonas aeruginosa]
MKNFLAAIGLAVVLKKSYELYCEYSELKRERKTRQASSTYGNTSSGAVPTDS